MPSANERFSKADPLFRILFDYLREHQVTNYLIRSASDRIYGYPSYDSDNLTSEILASMIKSSRIFKIKNIDNLKTHIAVRKKSIVFAKKAKFSYKSGSPQFDRKYWTYDASRGGMIPAANVSWADALNHLFLSPKGYSIECKRAVRFAQLAGVLAVNPDKNPTPPQWGLRQSLVSKEDDWVPGDYSYLRRVDPIGGGHANNGENVLYIGKGRWWGHAAQQRIYTLDEWKQTLMKWNDVGKGVAS